MKKSYSGFCNPLDAARGRANHRYCRGEWSFGERVTTCACSCHGNGRRFWHRVAVRRVRDVLVRT